MPLWKLTPIDVADPNWEASTHKGEVIARAGTEERARDITYAAFTIAAPARYEEPVKITPWRYLHLVMCEPFESDDYDAEGPERILLPERTIYDVQEP